MESSQKRISRIREIYGKNGQVFMTKLKEVCPKLERITDMQPLKAIFSREVLPKKIRQLMIIAGLLSIPNARPILRVHIDKAHQMGCSLEHVVEVIIQMAVYIGFESATEVLEIVEKIYQD